MITRLTLTNFRNHQTFRIDAAGSVALVGKNGTGKTNILEAISLLGGGIGLRHAASCDIARFGADGYAIAATLASGDEISVFWDLGAAHRRAKINGKAAPLSDLAKIIGVAWLTPFEDLLFAGPAAARRGFFDNLAGSAPSHAGRVARLAKLLSERAFALKNGHDEHWLDAIENNIVSVSVAIADARVRYAAELNHFLDGEIGLLGLLEQKIIAGQKAADIENTYRDYLRENRLLLGDKQVIDGAHKTDFIAWNAELGLAADKTSSGQQKLMLNRIVIASAKLARAKNPDRPAVILLDEADSHLDAAARNHLFVELAGAEAQVWMSGTDAHALNMPDAAVCDV
ncbi:MAG: AAA family ATPase [Rickettsiales bacterium]|jgi:DNA replication and repair protein RecF|nr:AAA family ATPase [Rickettsiales bacterium]